MTQFVNFQENLPDTLNWFNARLEEEPNWFQTWVSGRGNGSGVGEQIVEQVERLAEHAANLWYSLKRRSSSQDDFKGMRDCSFNSAIK